MRNILVTFSGGRTSAFMAKYIKERYCNDNILFVFANTGKEAEATLEFANKCDKEFELNLVWLEAEINPEKGIGTAYKIVDFETANRNGLPFRNAIKKYGLPSKVYRHCTRELKEVPIHKFAKEWKKQPFDLELKDYQGNCDLCFQKSVRKRLTIIKENPETSEWWIDMENQFAKEFQDKMDMRNNLSVLDLVEMAKQPFSKAIDKQELRDANPSLFEIELDYEESCFCSRT